MKVYISILRGINVSGHRIIKMELLKRLLQSLGFFDVKAYIQSGNIVFQSKENYTKEIEELIQNSIKKHFGFDVPVMTFTAEEWIRIANENPLIKDRTKDIQFFHITFLSEKPQIDAIEQLKNLNTQNDEFYIIENAVYLYCPNGYGNTKLTNTLFERKLKVNATTRNWKTVLKLRSLID